MTNLAFSEPLPEVAPELPGNVPEEIIRPIPRITIQAFCETNEVAEALKSAASDRRLVRAQVSVQMGGIPAAVEYFGNSSTPNLVIVETAAGRNVLLPELDRLANVCDSGTKVIIVGHVNDVQLYRELVGRGVSEYIVPPVAPLQIIQSISHLYTDPGAKPVGQVITFIGAKGGSGSSTVCHNTAWAISEDLQANVVIADFDLAFGTAGLDFNQDPIQGISEALNTPDRFDEVMLDRLLAKCSEHLNIFAAPSTLDRDYDLDAKSCQSVVDVLRANVPIVALDVPHVWTGWARNVLHLADDVVITAEPDLANLRNTKNLIDLLMASRSHDRPPYLILNNVGLGKRPEISTADFSAAVGLNPILELAHDSQLFGTAANNGQMIEELQQNSKAAEGFRDLAALLMHRRETKSDKKSLLAPLLEKLGRMKG